MLSAEDEQAQYLVPRAGRAVVVGTHEDGRRAFLPARAGVGGAMVDRRRKPSVGPP
ncbi:hypothetical protein OHT52_02880 [Streptomyces sp. NBC_00247]|uniref:hypothetical protein n=1 Tax=Streptomyces sp. NBC_00247 TaxID=2975689 RepID=UPI002E285C44|nr:hypothetical protein [Streptomyces sp. NBC_00247]